MRSWLSKLFAENSDVSWTRVAGTFCVLAATGIAFYTLAKGCSLDGSSTTIGLFLGAAFGAKVSQKFAEVKGKNDNSN